MNIAREPELAELAIADPPEAWQALGFDVDENGNLDIGGVRVRLGGEGSGITSWSLIRVNAMGSIDGLPTPVPRVLRPAARSKTHPNGATGIDHVVVFSSDLERTGAALARAGVELKRVQESPRGRMGFRRIGPAVLEVVQRDDLDDETEFWGLVVVVISLDELAQRLGDVLGPIKPATQPGRRIATLRSDAGVSPALAFMSPEPP